MWFKKKADISGYNANTAFDGTDWRTNGNGHMWWSISNTLPAAADASNYFYCPNLGYYNTGQLLGIGGYGYYLSSSAYPQSPGLAYILFFNNSYLLVGSERPYYGFRLGTFE